MENQEFEKELKRFIGLNNKLESSSVDEEIENLTEQDIFAIVVLQWSLFSIGTTYRSFKKLGWSKYKVWKIAKNEKYIHSEPLYDENTGLLSGKGYVIDDNIIEILNIHTS